MSQLPPLATRDRVIDAVLVISCGIGQAAALAVAAFATRDAFAALHGGDILPVGTVIELAVSGIVAAACLLMSRRRAEALGQSYAIALRRVLYAQIAKLPKSRHEQRRVGALSLRFVGDLSAARLWFGRGLPDVSTACVVLPSAVMILFWLNPELALPTLAPLGAALLIMGAIAWHLERRHRQLRRRRAGIAISMIERIAIAPELDLMGRTDKELRSLDENGAALRADSIARRSRTAGLQSILQIGVAVSGLVMLWLASQTGTPPANVAASLSVLALVALPLQDLGAAWDKFCAWRIAREKAQKLLDEPILERRSRSKAVPVSVALEGHFDGEPVRFVAREGEVTHLSGKNALQIARHVSGLDAHSDLNVSFAGQDAQPQIAHIGDQHVGLQGSLRRAATLMSRKKPKNRHIAQVLKAFGLDDLVTAPRGLDQRIYENGKALTAGQTLRLDLARAVLGKADLIVIASHRWTSEPNQADLLQVLRAQTGATVILAETANTSKLIENPKAH